MRLPASVILSGVDQGVAPVTEITVRAQMCHIPSQTPVTDGCKEMVDISGVNQFFMAARFLGETCRVI